MSDSALQVAEAVRITRVRHRYKAVTALENVSLTVPVGSDTAIIGPDGVGKSTLLSLIAGARKIQGGQVHVFGGDMARLKHRSRVAPKIAFMPQGLGRNLYPSLSVSENIAFFASLYATPPEDRDMRRSLLLKATGLDPFPDRPAGKLSGGMRQKLALCCALVHDPELLILDEPTTGIDPLSRRQFWQLIDAIRDAQPGLTLIVATAYMEEAERFSRLIAMDGGRILASGPVADVLAAASTETVEAAYVALRHPGQGIPRRNPELPWRRQFDGPPAIAAKGLTRRYGTFTAVDDVSFQIERGEIFGFLGSNGCGKTTTMKMLTGLIPATTGSAELLGKRVDATDIDTRQRVGYMSQSFSLYGELSVRGNLELHAKLYRIDSNARNERVSQALIHFGLEGAPDAFPAALPLGVRQRLQLAVACLHQPEVLILDEPTSGVDPEARDSFWQLLVGLSRRDGVTIFISTHFMNEAERCDRLSFMHAGKVLAVGTPETLRAEHSAATLEDAFIACLENAADPGPTSAIGPLPLHRTERRRPSGFATWFNWVTAFARRERLEVLRDPIRLSFAFLAPLVLMMTFARGISFDIEDLPFSIFDRDQSAESLALTLHVSGSRYFSEQRPALSDADADLRLQSGEAAVVIEIPPGFGRELLRGHRPEISLWLDGANPARASTARGYAEGIVQSFIGGFLKDAGYASRHGSVRLQPRLRYNQDFRSVFAMTPGVMMFLIMMIMSMMTALSVVREREIGSIINLSVSPATAGSFLIGKFAPYAVIGVINLVLMTTLAVALLGLEIKGSFAALILGGALYVIAATTFGIFVSTFVQTQVAAIFVCAILTMLPALNFSGFLQPISNLSREAQVIGLFFPSSWFQIISMGVFTKGLPFADLGPALIALAIFPIAYLLAASALINKQEL